MKLLKPSKIKLGHKEVADLIGPVIENQGAHSFVLTDAGMAMLIEMAAIEEGQAWLVLGNGLETVSNRPGPPH